MSLTDVEEAGVSPLLAPDAPDVLLCGGGTCRGLLRPRWHANDERLGLAAWSGHRAELFMFVWRLLFAGTMLGVFLTGAVMNSINEGPSFLATFSYFTLFEQLLASLLLLLCTLRPSLRPRLAGLAAAALAIGISTSVTVVIIFWGLLAPGFQWDQFLIHGVNCLVLILELFFDRIVFVPIHALFLLVFSLVYFVLILLPFQLSTGEVIYPGLTDFAQPGKLILTLIGVAFANTLFFFGFMVVSHLAKCGPGDGMLLLYRREHQQ